MARKYQTLAHTTARTHDCASCDAPLINARYEGEYCYNYDKGGDERMVSVYLVCRCGGINDVSVDVTDDDGFMTTVDEVGLVPRRAKKITTGPLTETA
jgi:hypothetical protein